MEREGAETLAEGERRGLDEHVSRCSECRDYREVALFAQKAFQAVELEPFPDHRSRKIMTLVRELPTPVSNSLFARLARLFTPSPQWGYAAVPGLAVALLLFWPNGQTALPPISPASPVAPPQIAALPATLGTVEASAAGLRVGGRTLPGPGKTDFKAGEEVALASGNAILRYADGTLIRLEEKARAVPGARSLELTEGRAFAAVSRTGAGFQLESCRFQVKVMGTRFSVDSARCEVQLLEGKVRTIAGNLASDLAPGEAVRHSGLRADRRTLTPNEKRELTLAFLRFEGVPTVAAALGLSEDALRVALKPAEPPVTGSGAAARSASSTAAAPVHEPAFDPLRGLR